MLLYVFVLHILQCMEDFKGSGFYKVIICVF